MADDPQEVGGERPVTSQGGRARPSARKRWLRRSLTIGIALGALGGFGMIVFNAWDGGRQPTGDKAVPVIKAEAGPTRIRPQTPGGLEVPNQDKQIYERLAAGDGPPQVERLIPPPEATVARPPPPEPTAEMPPAGTSEPAATPIVPAPLPPPPPEATPAPRPVAPPSQTATHLAAGAWRIQLAAVRSEDAARKAWADLSRQHADLFGKLDPAVVRVDLGEKGVYWRLHAGPLADATAARALCDRAKQRKLGCIIVKP